MMAILFACCDTFADTLDKVEWTDHICAADIHLFFRFVLPDCWLLVGNDNKQGIIVSWQHSLCHCQYLSGPQGMNTLGQCYDTCLVTTPHDHSLEYSVTSGLLL